MGGKVLKLKGEKYIEKIAKKYYKIGYKEGLKIGYKEGLKIGYQMGEVRSYMILAHKSDPELSIEELIDEVWEEYGISPENFMRLFEAYRPGRMAAEELKVYDEVFKKSGILNQDGTLAVS